MRNLIVFVFTAVMLMSCASVQPVPDPQVELDQDSDCGLGEEKVEVLRQAAMNYLVDEWPVLDAECESISEVATRRFDGRCQFRGGPDVTADCPEPSHQGYVLVFDKVTSEFQNVYWMQAAE